MDVKSDHSERSYTNVAHGDLNNMGYSYQNVHFSRSIQ